MKFLINQPDLARAAARASSVSNGKTSPILGNLLIRAEGERITLIGADQDMEIQEQAIARVEQPGTITVSASTLSEIARAAPNGAELLFTYNPADDARATLKFGRSRYQLPVLPAEDFPARQDLQDTDEISLQAHDLLRLLDHTHFAISTDDSRYYLCGVYLHFASQDGASYLRATATDGHRLAQDQVPADCAPNAKGLIVPRKAAQEMRRTLGDLKDTVALRMSDRGLSLTTPTGRVTTKAIDGQFPDYPRVTPTKWTGEAQIDRVLLKEALKRVGLVSNDKARAVKFVIEDGTLSLTARSDTTTTAHEEIEINEDAPSVEIGFNVKYILDTLDQTDADRMLLRYSQSGDPARLDPDPAAKHADHIINVVMPQRG